jgi:hypothetical protein
MAACSVAEAMTKQRGVLARGVKDFFLVNGGAFAARRLRVYIRSLYNRFVTDILVRIQLR